MEIGGVSNPAMQQVEGTLPDRVSNQPRVGEIEGKFGLLDGVYRICRPLHCTLLGRRHVTRVPWAAAHSSLSNLSDFTIALCTIGSVTRARVGGIRRGRQNAMSAAMPIPEHRILARLAPTLHDQQHSVTREP